MICVLKIIIKSGKGKYKYQKKQAIFRPAEDISYVYVLNQIFESVSNLFSKQILKRIDPLTTYGI